MSHDRNMWSVMAGGLWHSLNQRFEPFVFSSPFRVWSPGWHRVGNMSKSRRWIAEPTLVDRGQQRVRASPQRAIQPTASTTRGELLCSHERQRKTHCKSPAYQGNLHITERGLKIWMHVFGHLNFPLLLSSPVSIERISEMNDWFSCCNVRCCSPGLFCRFTDLY